MNRTGKAADTLAQILVVLCAGYILTQIAVPLLMEVIH